MRRIGSGTGLKCTQPRFGAKALVHVLACFIQRGIPGPCIVRVAGQEVHQPSAHQLVRAPLRSLAEPAQQGLRRHLYMNSLRHPGFQIRQAELQQLIALRMGHDGT